MNYNLLKKLPKSLKKVRISTNYKFLENIYTDIEFLFI